MADSDSSAGSWPGFIDQLNKTFMLIRDVFGYALPGAVFLGVGIISKKISLGHVNELLYPYNHMPAWLAFLGVVAVSYAVGGIMAAVAYSPFMIAKFFVWIIVRHSSPGSPPADEHQPEGTPREWLANHPTEVSSEIVEIRSQQPKLLDTLDRRETLALLSGSLTTALLGGWLVFCRTNWRFPTILWIGGLFALLQFFTGMPHLRRVAKSIKIYYESSKEAKPEPDFSHLLASLIQAAQDLLAALKAGLQSPL